MNRLLRPAWIALTACMTAGAAHAATITIKETGLQGATVYTQMNGSSDPLYNADAANQLGFVSSTGASFVAYCVEYLQYTSTSFQTYTIGSFSGALQQNLSNLYSAVYSGVQTDSQRAAFQLAVWEMTHESLSSTLSLSSGNFKGTADNTLANGGAGIVTLANSYLSQAKSYTGPAQYTLTKLSNTTYQDLVVATPVPEPATTALWLAGLLAVGGAARRRRQAG